MLFAPKRVALSVLVLFSCVTVAFAQNVESTAPKPAKVFALNLWTAPVDLKLGSEGLFSTTGLAPASASQIVNVEKVAPRAVYYRATASEQWLESKKADGNSLFYDLKQGGIYMVLVQENGVPGLYELNAEPGDKAKIAVFNATGKDLPLLRIGASVSEGVELQGDGLGLGWTDFGDIVAGTHSVFWAYPGMPEGSSYFYIPSRDGTSPGKIRFAAGGWYLLLLRHDSASSTDSGLIWDISPATR